MMQNVQKVESVNTQSNCKLTCKNRTDLSSMFTHIENVLKGGDRYYTK